MDFLVKKQTKQSKTKQLVIFLSKKQMSLSNFIFSQNKRKEQLFLSILSGLLMD